MVKAVTLCDHHTTQHNTSYSEILNEKVKIEAKRKCFVSKDVPREAERGCRRANPRPNCPRSTTN